MSYFNRHISRRSLVAALGVLGGSGVVSGPGGSRESAAAGRSLQTPDQSADEIVIDLAGGPDNLDPALTRSTRDWSVLHSVYDSILLLSDDGELVPLAAETFHVVDDVTYEVTLRSGLRFHDGTPVTSDAVERGIAHVRGSEGPAAGNFGVVERVEIVDELTARIVTTEPAAWLPSQLAVWLVLFPEDATPESLATRPVGSGPFRFESLDAGNEVMLSRNPDYTWPSPKGVALAERARFRFVPESTTRIANLSSGDAQIIAGISSDQIEAVENAGGEVIETPVLGTAFLRIATDAAPFDDPRVGTALNHAIDVDAISEALLGEQSRRLASIFPDERSIGFDPDLAPFAYDPTRARELLAEAGVDDGFEVRLQFVAGERDDLLQAITAQLGDVGLRVTLESTELATFNGSWTDPGSAPLRFVTWRPVFDPHTLLSLMFASSGPLARSGDAVADDLIRRGAVEPRPEARAEIYRELGRHFQQVPPAVYLWNLTATYGIRDIAGTWTPRGDEYIIPTHTEEVK